MVTLLLLLLCMHEEQIMKKYSPEPFPEEKNSVNVRPF